MSDTGNHNESSPIPNSVETVIPKPSKPCVTLQAICERCVYFAVQRIFPRWGSITRSHPKPSPFGSVHVLQLGTIKRDFIKYFRQDFGLDSGINLALARIHHLFQERLMV